MARKSDFNPDLYTRRHSPDGREEINILRDRDPYYEWVQELAEEGAVKLVLRASPLVEILELPRATENEILAARYAGRQAGHYPLFFEFKEYDKRVISSLVNPSKEDRYSINALPDRCAGVVLVSEAYVRRNFHFGQSGAVTRQKAYEAVAEAFGNRLWATVNGWTYCWSHFVDGRYVDSGDGFMTGEEALKDAKRHHPGACWSQSELANHPYVKASGRYIPR